MEIPGAKKVVEIGDAVLILGDCLECLKSLDADALITDPPYGVNLGDAESRVSNGGYENYVDDLESFIRVVPPSIELALERTKRGAVFMAGRSLRFLPRPTAIGGVYSPAGAGTTAWGFTCFHPLAFYGAAPWAHRGLRPNVLRSGAVSEKNGHPCPKPLPWMLWAVDFASLEGECVIDPFCGSGSTGVACATLNRKFIGIEIAPKYYEIALERITNAYRQKPMFDRYDEVTRSYEQVKLL